MCAHPLLCPCTLPYLHGSKGAQATARKAGITTSASSQVSKPHSAPPRVTPDDARASPAPCTPCPLPPPAPTQSQALTHHPCTPQEAIPTLTHLGLLQEAAITVDYQPDNDRPRKERHRANSAAPRLAYSSTLRTLIAIYVPSVRENHNSCAGSLLLPSLLFVGVTSYNHNRNFQNPYLA